MKFSEIDRFLCRMLQEKVCGDYAVLIHCKGEEKLLTSPCVNRDTYFDNASLGKIFITAPLILRAIGEGKLTLDTVLADCFPDVPEDKKGITVKQLLTHTAGITTYGLPPEASEMSRHEQASLILRYPLVYTPGESYIYSCFGFILLGFLAEKIYGAPLDRVFEQYIRKPLGYTRSRFNIAVDEPNAAVCYSRKDVGEYRADDGNVRVLKGVAGNGASYSTAGDIQIFVQAVLDRSPVLYHPSLYALAETDYTPDFSEGRGLGYLMPDVRYRQTGRLFPEGSFGHCGHTGQSVFINRAEDLYVILLTNTTRYSNIRSGFCGYDYGDTMRMRENVHNAIYEDLKSAGLISY